MPQQRRPTFVLFTRPTFLLGPLFQLAKKIWPNAMIFMKTSSGFSLFTDMCSWDPFHWGHFFHPLESFIFKSYNIWAMNSMFSAHGDILAWRQGFITSRLRLEIFMHNEGKQKFYNSCSFWSIGWKSIFQTKIIYFSCGMRRGGSGSFITSSWQLVKSQNYRLSIEIFMLYDVKRKFYNNQLAVQRSLACV